MNNESRIMNNSKKSSSYNSCFIIHNSYLRGFTLVEIMVATSIFVLVMIMAAGALISIIDANRKAQAQHITFTNLDFALESMARAINDGDTYRCVLDPLDFGTASIDDVQDCSSGASAFAFESYFGQSGNFNDQIVYRLNNNRIERSTSGGSSFIAITSPQIVIEGLKFFYVRGTTVGDIGQPMVLLSIYGYSGSGKSKVDFNLQTAISQLTLDI